MRAHAFSGLMLLVTAAAVAACDGEEESPGAGGAGGSKAGAGGARAGGPGAGAGGSGARSGSPSGGTPSAGASAGEGGSSGADAGAANLGGEGGLGQAGAAGAGNGGEGGDGGPTYPPETPILERTTELGYDCTVARPMSLLGVQWGGGTPLLGEGGPYLARVAGDLGGITRVEWSTLALDGTLGTTKPVYEAEESSWLGRARAAAHADHYALVWPVSGENQALYFADVDGTGAARETPKTLDFAGTVPSSPLIIEGGEGLALAWLDQPGELMSELKFALLDEDGEAAEPPQTVAQGSGGIFPEALAKIGDGYLLAYSHIDYGASIAKTFVLALDAEGEPRRTATELPGGFGGASILVRGDKALVAWGVADNAFEFSDRAETLQLGWFRADGTLIGESSPLQAPIVDEENKHPHFVDFGEDVGLFWSQGSIIYICAGCYPDNHVKFVLLDDERLVPKSELLDLPSPNMYGLLYPEAVRLEDEVLVTAGLTRHVDGEGVSARVACPASP